MIYIYTLFLLILLPLSLFGQTRIFGIVEGEKPLYFFLERYMDAYANEVKAFVECVVKDTDSSSKQQAGKKWRYADVSETETSETSYSGGEDDGDDEEDEEHGELALAKMLNNGAVVDKFETSIQLKEA